MGSKFYPEMAKRKYNGSSYPQKAVKAARQGMWTVPRTMGAAAVTERKYWDQRHYTVLDNNDTTWIGSNIDPTAVGCLFAPPEGAEINERVGRKVSIWKIQIRGHFSTVPYFTEDGDPENKGALIRLILYQDMQTNGVQVPADELMNGALTNDEVIHGFQNANGFGRFRVLRDKMYVLQNPFGHFISPPLPPTRNSNNGLQKPFKLTYKFKKPIVVRFNNVGGGTVASVIDNSLHLCAHTNGISPVIPWVNYKVRVTYTDN